MATNDFAFVMRKESAILLICQDREKGFYVRNFAAERVCDADSVGRVGFDESSAFRRFGNDVIDENAAVDEIDFFIVCDELLAVEFEFAGIGDNCGNSHFFETRLQNLKLAKSGDVFPIDYGDLRRAGGASPVHIAHDQGVEEFGAERVTMN